MKKFTFLLSFLTYFATSNSQTIDTVSLGEGLDNQAYYNLLDGAEENDLKNDWDIAFQTGSSFGTSILINEATGTELYLYPGDTTDWSTLDTTGMIANWSRLHNSDTSWDYGAFSQNQSGFDIGWGTYDMVTHNIVGDELYVIKLSNGDFQKVWIKNLIAGSYNFRHATLNNSMDMMHSLAKADFTGKNFGYFSLQTHSKKDKEPLAENWDLFFGQYTAFIPSAYLVSGVLLSAQTEAAKVYPVNDPSTYIDWQANPSSGAINTIGYDWKSFNMSTMQYEIADSTVYFVKNQHGDVFKLIFTHYGGSTTGDIVFEKTHIHFSGVESNEVKNEVVVYPNPANDLVTVVFESSENTTLQILDQNGRLVKQENLSNNAWNHNVNLSDLTSGLYLLRIVNNTGVSTKKLLIN